MTGDLTHLSGSEQEIVKAVSSGMWHGVQQGRMGAALQRRMVYESRFANLVANVLWDRMENAEARAEAQKFISVAFNIARTITDSVAVIYKQGVGRILRKKGAIEKSVKQRPDKLPEIRTDPKQNGIDLLNKQSRLDELAPEINRKAYYIGPVLEVPWVNERRFTRTIFTPDAYEVLIDPADPLGPPIAAAFPWFHPTAGRVVGLLDNKSMRFFDNKGQQVGAGIDHGATLDNAAIFPGTLWRTAWPTDVVDYYTQHENTGLQEATLEVAFLYTLLSWVRKSQNKHLIHFFGNLDKFAKGQVWHPEIPIVQDQKPGEDAPEVGSDNIDVSPKNFIDHMMFVFRQQIESKGIPQSAVTNDFINTGSESAGAGALSIQYEKLSSLRNAQKPFFRASEHSSAVRSVAVATGMDWDGASLPTTEDVAERFYLKIPELNRVDDPMQMREQTDWEISKKLINSLDLMKARNPDLNDQEAAEEMARNAIIETAFNDFLAARNQSKNPDAGEEVKGAAQLNGELGPQVRDAAPEGDPEGEGDGADDGN